MSYSGTPTLYGEQQIAAAYQSGTRLPVVSIAVGDGNGATVTPTEGMTHLVNEVWRGPITSWGVDPADTRRIVVRTTIPPTAGPFVVREAGIFDSQGGLIAVTALAATEIVAPGTSNQATSIDLIVALPIGSAGAITVSPTLGERFTIERLIRTPFISINSASTPTPPAAPAVGDLYIVPSNPTGAWATATLGTIAEWNGIFWGFMAPPLKMVAGIMDAADDAVAEYLKWNGTAWEVLATAGSIFTVVDTAAASTADELVGTATPGLTALQANMVFRWRQGAAANKTTVPKGNVSNAAGTALGDVPFTKADGSALAIGDLPPNADFLTEYDASGPRFRVLGPRLSDVLALILANQQASLISGGRYVTYTSGSGTWLCPAGVNTVHLRMWGGGGGGGGCLSTTTASGGSGGGGAQYAEGTFAVTPGQSYAWAVGAGGPGGLGSTPGNGSAGGTSSFGGLISASGGGPGNAAANAMQTTSAGQGGSSGAGPFILSGSNGGYPIAVTSSSVLGGIGGAAPFGGSTPGPNNNFAGLQGLYPGGGANGGAFGGTSGNNNGGPGASGLIMLTY